jgi:hypothetical protein
MGYASAQYQQAHTNLKRVRGEAREHTCPCGKPALDWAYIFTGETLTSSDGSRPYSNNPDDYMAMCRKCHIAFDTEHDPAYAERRRVGIANGRAAVVEMSKTDPAYIKMMNGVRQAVNAVRVQCGECDLVSTRGGLGNHQKHSQHNGRKELG